MLRKSEIVLRHKISFEEIQIRRRLEDSLRSTMIWRKTSIVDEALNFFAAMEGFFHEA
jgi:hypothetical protein